MTSPTTLAQRLVDGTLDVQTFGHAEHVAAAYALLNAHPFDDALHRYATGIRALATRAGAADKFHMTITTAFLSLIAERMHRSGAASFDDLVAKHPELLSPALIEQHYTPTRLHSPLARRLFVLPDRLTG